MTTIISAGCCRRFATLKRLWQLLFDLCEKYLAPGAVHGEQS